MIMGSLSSTSLTSLQASDMRSDSTVKRIYFPREFYGIRTPCTLYEPYLIAHAIYGLAGKADTVERKKPPQMI